MTETDAGLLRIATTNEPQKARRKSSFYDEEEIVIKPSTELIPDEYKFSVDDTVAFHIFKTDDDEENAQDILDAAEFIQYKVDSTNLHNLNTKKEFFQDLYKVKEDIKNKSGLFLLVIGYFDKKHPSAIVMMDEQESCVEMTDIWNKFSANNCPELKNKPKIFMFCLTQVPEPNKICTDSKLHRTIAFQEAYDFPAESDMLIVYKKADDSSPPMYNFLENFTFNIKNYSKKYDIIDLISHINEKNTISVPLIISTLTRKFYLTPNIDREHFLSVVENTSSVQDDLREIKEGLEKLHELQKKKKDKMFSFSFRKKTEEKPKIEKKESGTKAERKTSKTGSTKKTPVASPTPPRPRRSHRTSESDSGTVQKKPIWKI